jgi:4-hydroxy-2-oxoglutarate aldolase
VGTKLSCGNLGKLHRLTSTVSSDSFSTFPGKSDVFVPSLLLSSSGLIGALPNIAPKAHVRAYELWKMGKVKEALELQEVFSHADALIGKTGGVAGVKSVVSWGWGYGEGWVRGPLVERTLEAVKGVNGWEWMERLVAIEKELCDK